MILLSLLIIALSFVPAWIIWTPRLKKLWVKITLCVLSSVIGIFLIAALVRVNDSSEQYNAAITIGADLRNVIHNEAECFPDKYNEEAVVQCILTFIEETQKVNKDYPDLEILPPTAE